MGDLLDVAGAHVSDLAGGGIVPDGDGCEYAAAVAAEVYTLADVLGQLIEAIRRQDQVIGLLLDMSRERR